RQSPTRRRHDVAFCDAGAADPPVDRSAYFCVVKIDLRDVQLRLGALDLRRQAAFRGERRIDIRLRTYLLPQQVLGAIQCNFRIPVLRLKLVDGRFAALDLRLKRRLFQLVEQVSFLDFGAFDEQPLFEKPADSGNERDAPYSLDATDELVAFCNLL